MVAKTYFLFRTFSYVERELSKVPSHIPVLVLANHRDMGHHRTVNEDSIKYFIENLDRSVKSISYFLKIYSHKIFKVFFYYYVHQLTYQNTILTHYFED